MVSYLPAQENNNLTNSNDLRSVVFMQQMEQFNSNTSGVVPEIANRRVTVVRQIGDFNTVNSQTISETADLGYLQIGDANTIESFSSIRSYSERIIQQGNDNEVLNYSFGPVDSATFNLIQSGNNLTFQKIGTNSQTDNMSFRLTGADRTVIIRSY